ncbi:peptidylprolyl isomerase [Psychroflexus sp. S27]|nr:peptidylprolyl isomerase [Psychroflexus sp. S27]
MMKYALILVSVLFLSCQQDTNKDSENESEKETIEKKEPEVVIPSAGDKELDLTNVDKVNQEELMPFLEKYFKENKERRFVIKTDFGNIKIELYDDTPWHTANFLRLTKLGYFNTTFFHRVADDFVIQGGNSDKVITHRFRSKVGKYLIPNEAEAQHKHKYGVVSAAKYSEQNVSNASSPFEFFIVVSERGAHHLDKDHTVFGRVIEGMDVAEKISEVEVDESEWPLSNVGIKVEVLD